MLTHSVHSTLKWNSDLPMSSSTVLVLRMAQTSLVGDLTIPLTLLGGTWSLNVRSSTFRPFLALIRTCCRNGSKSRPCFGEFLTPTPIMADEMFINFIYFQTFNTFQGKTSVRTKPCTGDCANAKICYIRSGSASIARQNCQQGFGSVQS